MNTKLAWAILLTVVVLGAGGYWYFDKTAPVVVTTPQETVATTQETNPSWGVYVNSQHGYTVNYPPDFSLGFGGLMDPNGQKWNTLPAFSKEWYESTCVGLNGRSGPYNSIYINISTRYSETPCGVTGFSSTYREANDIFSVNGMQINVYGRMDPDLSEGVFRFTLGDSRSTSQSERDKVLYVEYGMSTPTNATTSPTIYEYQQALTLVHSILSTLKQDSDFVPSTPPDDGARG